MPDVTSKLCLLPVVGRCNYVTQLPGLISSSVSSRRRRLLSGPSIERNVRGTLAFVPVVARSQGEPLIQRNIRISSQRNLARNPRKPPHRIRDRRARTRRSSHFSSGREGGQSLIGLAAPISLSLSPSQHFPYDKIVVKNLALFLSDFGSVAETNCHLYLHFTWFSRNNTNWGRHN